MYFKNIPKSFKLFKRVNSGQDLLSLYSYPDGWHVFCKKLNNNETYNEDGYVVHFYQSGFFTAMIRDIKPVGKMKRKFV